MLLLNGDCIKEMQKLIDDGKQVDSIVTDPPYHLTSITERFGKEGSAPAQHGTDGAFARASKGFMGKEWDGGDIAFRKETWELAYKLLKPGGHLLAFSGSRTYHRMAVAIEDAGFDIRDQIMWLYGSGFPKSLNLGKSVDKKLGNERIKTGQTKTHSNKGMPQAEERTAIGAGAFGQEVEEEITVGTTEWEGWGTALKPAHEPIVMARKALSENSIVANVLKHGTGGINIDGCRIEGEVNRPPTNPSFRDVAKEALARGGLDKLSFGQDRDRPIERKKVVRKSRSEDGVWTDDNSGMKAEGSEFADADPRGRFPANVMHDGSEVVKDIFPHTKSGKDKNPTEGNVSGFFGNNMGYYSKDANYGDEGSAARYFYCPKVSRTERDKGLSGKKDGKPVRWNKAGEWTNDTTPAKNSHPTVKPVELMKYLCRMVTPKGGTVLDIFMGSGSTGMAAKDEGFDFIGIEKDKEYFQIAEQRIKVTAPLSEFME